MGVGVDGVGVIFPLFLRIFPLFTPASPKRQGQTTAIYCKNGEFHSDPVCTDPVQNFPIFALREYFPENPCQSRSSGVHLVFERVS